MNWKKFISLSVIFVTGCAPPEAPDAALSPLAASQAQKQTSPIMKTRTASEVSSWTITGALAAKNKTDAWTASIHWTQNGPNNYNIRLFGPLGGGSILLEKKNGVVTYQDTQKRIKSHNADGLMYQQTGIRIPIQDLYYWVRGLPAPGAIKSADHDSSQNLTYLEQAGYAITYLNYTNRKGINLPSKIHVRGSKGNLKIIIKRWETH